MESVKPFARRFHGISHRAQCQRVWQPQSPVSYGEGTPLRLLSFNVQVGNRTERYHHYLTRCWQHLLPHRHRLDSLQQIAGLLRQYDLVALQEVDGGSLRSGYINQIEYLAQQGAFPYWYQQLNRNMGRFAQHSNGLLSRLPPESLEDHKLPGLIPGRGAIVSRYQIDGSQLLVIMLHLSLSRRSRNQQLSYIRSLMRDATHTVLMGDMNTQVAALLERSPLEGSGLIAAHSGVPTFPSWRPTRALDHILISPGIRVDKVDVLDFPLSDHLPVGLELRLAPPVH
ncbi:endonuclease/exonuclease/phosphatase family protein [Aestuariirhabdus sp. Z084]|uniref:endonuclease/exonuclease/phosphatase family protein n=1 Tax=Aestuariirhabdus haliotis TaxID=2918751 RepID=UPI00201B43E7|nr:endonuclease/exonuclease/phosphatase family protein [Aestuariirhabdus haliotis]MCL6414289.1 endonuclease/exonuclease/phosphatase family protein [Aestuariirhabdus haliotis]MCL6418221.1 endonuclease/exonuclease/phosphatase family protein [Aestuariirhabdus haliotis]